MLITAPGATGAEGQLGKEINTVETAGIFGPELLLIRVPLLLLILAPLLLLIRVPLLPEQANRIGRDSQRIDETMISESVSRNAFNERAAIAN